jgi:hypothetical protein
MLVPSPLPRALPPPIAMTTLPASAVGCRVDAAQVDATGRICVGVLLDRLGWQQGQTFALDLAEQTVILRPSASSRHSVGARGTLTLPAAARRMAGILCGSMVIVSADMTTHSLYVYPETLVVELLAVLHAAVETDRHDGRS